jgi:selenide,water dikinase
MKTPPVLDVVLIGGGHAHFEILRSMAMKPDDRLRLTVVARDTVTPYSGMLPGYLAGIYTHSEAHIDLRPLCARAGARLIHAPATGIDPERRMVLFDQRPALRFDLASLDIGSTPVKASIDGAERHAIPVKPVDRFLEQWQEVEERLRGHTGTFHLTVVGGGAGGLEVCLGLRHRLQATVGGNLDLCVTLVSDGDELLPRHGSGVRRRMEAALKGAGVTVHKRRRVVAVNETTVTCQDGLKIPSDAVVLVTGAAPAPWLCATGLGLDDDGFVAVDACLRSTTHPFIWAAGDIASFTPRPLIKNGVYAVRQGPLLAANMRRFAEGLPLRPFQPQQRTMAMITTGERHAVASWGGLSFQGDWVWRWKDRIDRRWMEKYRNLPPMTGMDATSMRCGGCGAKVPAQVLRRALARLDIPSRPEVLVGLQAPDDAAVLAPQPGKAIVQTVDQFPAFVDDPFVFGRIAAVHALSDIHAMGAEPVAAMALAGLLPGGPDAMENDLVAMLSGIVSILRAENCALVGGHTIEADQASLGLSVTGFAEPGDLVVKGGLRAGDRLLLTKPLGTGTLFAADMRGEAQSAWIEEALAGMQQSNGPAARILIEHGVSAMTDVTGFGLAGHLMEMLHPSEKSALLDPDALPAYAGARELLSRGIASTLHPGNTAALEGMLGPDCSDPLLFDPQTAGGLLAGVAPEKVEACLTALRAAGYNTAAIIGTVTDGDGAPAIRTRQPG